MKFRMWLFRILAILVALYVLATIAGAGEVNSTSRADCARQYTSQVQIDACMAGSDIGTGLGVTVILCIGGFLFLVFALLAWRNGAGLKAAQRHAELLAAQRGE